MAGYGTVVRTLVIKKHSNSRRRDTLKRLVKAARNDGYRYITKHGIGPGTIPKDVHLLKAEDLPNWKTAIWLDRPLTSEELKYYDIYPEWVQSEEDIYSADNGVRAATIEAGKYTDHDIYTRGRQRFSVYMSNVDDPENFQCQVSMLKPYDDADYAWARKTSHRIVDIIQDRKVVDHYTVPRWDAESWEDETEYINEVIDSICTALIEYNADIEPVIIHN